MRACGLAQFVGHRAECPKSGSQNSTIYDVWLPILSPKPGTGSLRPMFEGRAVVEANSELR
jgi:hypothetical protein